jgi:hypothetical protein
MSMIPNTARIEAFAEHLRHLNPDEDESRVISKAIALATRELAMGLPTDQPVAAALASPELSPTEPMPPRGRQTSKPARSTDFKRGLSSGLLSGTLLGAAITITAVYVIGLSSRTDLPATPAEDTSKPSPSDLTFVPDSISLKVRQLTNPGGSVGVYPVLYMGSYYEVIIDAETMEFGVLTDIGMMVKKEKNARTILEASW